MHYQNVMSKDQKVDVWIIQRAFDEIHILAIVIDHRHEEENEQGSHKESKNVDNDLRFNGHITSS